MRMMNNSADDEEQLATPEKEMNLLRHDSAESVSVEPRDYGALLAMTRPHPVVARGENPEAISMSPPLSLLGMAVPKQSRWGVRDCHASFAITPVMRQDNTIFPLLMGD